ncbi:tRNA pseudouridine(38-40) synthase TruA [Croceiramulus getboli]|nr:tRNA pseudouridine(38-40) synthase TruA [Flavobacteriaceae bacterium YJPT1-3]
MFEKRFYYLFELQYLGFRYHGWQKQPDVLTVERMVGRTLAYVLGHKNFKTLAIGRTDAKVSVNHTYVELFLKDDALEPGFLELFNKNLPQDIRALSMEEVTADFNLMESALEKEYLYLFANAISMHPFAAPLMINKTEPLDIELMQKAARLFEGTHDFRSYCYKPKPTTQTVLSISRSEIVINDLYQANFFPDESYIFRVIGQGFKRHQVRLMMGMLFDIGNGSASMDDLKESLALDSSIHLSHIAPPSGLLLNQVRIKR